MGHKWQLHVFSIILLKSLIYGVCYIFKSILGHLDSIYPDFYAVQHKNVKKF